MGFTRGEERTIVSAMQREYELAAESLHGRRSRGAGRFAPSAIKITHMSNQDDFRLEWHGDVVVVTPASNIESMNWDLIEQAADVIMSPLRDQSMPLVVVDLSEVGYFGSVFLALLLRCHKFVKSKGGELVLCGASPMAAELLRITALDTLWAMYDTREEALDALT